MQTEEVKVGVKGWVHVALINREGKVVHEHVQDNLILNRGLDYIMSSLAAENMIAYVAVGTSSTAPDPTQTSLGNEIARTNSTLGLGPDLQAAILGNGWYRITRARAFDYNQANGNLTEFGGSNTTSLVNTRELFRDANGTPIVITKTSNERLVITYSIEIKFNPVVATNFGTIDFRDNSGNIVASRIVRHLFTRPQVGYYISIDVSLLTNLHYDGSGGLLVGNPGTIYFNPVTQQINENYNATDVLFTSGYTATVASYTNGTYYRDTYAEIGPGASDITMYGYAIGRKNVNNSMCSYKAIFVDGSGNPAPFTKGKDYRLRFNQRFSISRL